MDRIRNFCIIAHIDHGKSTLADRLLEKTGVFEKREMVEQVLDSMELERERGITIKSKAVHMQYKAQDGETYTLNLIDTPGHVDFTYEVSRALAACEGALLVVDATQGVEAQTLANVYMALDHDLEIVPVINKIDLPSARPDEVREEIEDVIGLDASEAPLISAKVGIGIDEVLESVVKLMPAPTGDENAPLQARSFDSFYDNYRGAICFVRIVSGTVRPGMTIRMMNTGAKFDVVEVGVRSPGYEPMEALRAGDVGYIAASIKDLHDTRVGDTPVSATSSSAVHRPALHTPSHGSRLRVSRPSSAASKTDSSNARASPHSASVQLTTPWPSHTRSDRFLYPFLKKRSICFCRCLTAGGTSACDACATEEAASASGQQALETTKQEYCRPERSGVLER